MDVSVILVNYYTSDMTVSAVESIIDKTSGVSIEIIVVDNSCDDTEYNTLCNKLKGHALVIQANSNLGFGKANNWGAEKSNGDYLFFLNTDTRLINNSIYELHSFINNNKSVGVVGANLYDIEGMPNHSFVKSEKTIKYEKKNNSIFHFIKNRLTQKNEGFNYTDNPLKIKGYVCGAALMISRKNFEMLGGFSTEIFMYSEEVLLCYQVVHKLNKEIYNVPSAKIIHFGGGSQEKNKSMASLKNKIDGDYIYYRTCFGEKNALNFLKTMERIYEKKRFFSHVLLKGKEEQYYSELARLYLAKFQEITKQ